MYLKPSFDTKFIIIFHLKDVIVLSTITVKLDLLFVIVRCDPEFILTTLSVSKLRSLVLCQEA